MDAKCLTLVQICAASLENAKFPMEYEKLVTVS
jgi:hypothetical protein